MYFNEDNMDTNIDEEFDEGFMPMAINTLKKYKLIFIGAVVLEILILIILYFGSNRATNYLVLTGDDTVNIYQGTSYVEIGYEAYNSKNEDLNSQVTINSTLNTSIIGEYEISYKLGDLVRVRRVNVVEKPNNYTYIDLKTVNGKVDISLKLGEQYKEPGFEVYGYGKNLTENVRVIGEVDTSKSGTYSLTYMVVDVNNVTVSATRNVKVG